MVRQSNCLSFMEKFQKYLKQNYNEFQIYEFERAEIMIGDVKKNPKQGDFENAKKELEYAINFLYQAFNDRPD